MEVTRNLTLDNLECHFNWKPEVGTTKDNCIDDVIQKVKNKINRHPQFAVAYHCTLAYLYSSQSVNDFNEAYDYLEGGKPLEDAQSLNPPERWLDCDFIVKANLLKLKQLELLVNGKNNQDVTQELNELNEMWKETKVRASVYTVKGITYNCFGPMKHPIAVESFKCAIKLAEENSVICSDWHFFDLLWGLAFSMSRVTRHARDLEPSNEELNHWDKAFNWIDINNLEIDEPLFFANYAESIMLLKHKKNDCQKMIQKSLMMWKSLSTERKLLDKLVLNIALKFCAENPDSTVIKGLLTDVDVFEYLGDDMEDYRQFAKLLNYQEENETAIKLLETGRKKCAATNVYFDSQLLNRYAKLKSDVWINREYSSLLQKYKMYPKNIAFIHSRRSKWFFHRKVFPHKKNFMTTHGIALDECIFDLAQAKSKDPEISMEKTYLGQLKNVLRSWKDRRPEYLGWFMQNFEQNPNQNEIFRLYESVLNDEDVSMERSNFSRKNLGIFYLSVGKAADAVSTLRDLSKNEDCKVYFVQAVIKKFSSRTFEELIECLRLGNCDVIKLIMDTLKDEKKRIDVKNTILSENIPLQNSSTLFFSRSNYEVCAMIQLLLENDGSFFIDDGRVKSPEFKEEVKQRVFGYLEIPVESTNKVTYIWRKHRLDLTKSHLRLSDHSSDDEMRERTINTLHVLRDSRNALDACLSKYFNLKLDSHYAHAFQKMTTGEANWLKNHCKSQSSRCRDRPTYLAERMKDYWLLNRG